MNLVIQIVMISAAALMIIFCKAAPKKAVAGPVWQSGMVAVVAIYGIAWLADTYFSNYMGEMQSALEGIVAQYPWSIAIVFFLVSVLINQLSGRCGGSHAAAGIQVRYPWPSAPRCIALCLWILLHPELSVRYRNGELRPFWYDSDR